MLANPPVLPCQPRLRRAVSFKLPGLTNLSVKGLGRAWLAALMLMTGVVHADDSTLASSLMPPVPFTAQYTLALDGWPDVPITQRVSQSGELFIASMEASIKVASGYEQGRFTLNDDTIVPAGYRSGYRLAGIGKDYTREAPNAQEMVPPDRQTLLVALGQQADAQWAQGQCTQAVPCSIDYLDHKGRTRTLVYEVQAEESLQAADQTFRTLRLDAWREHRDQKHYRIWLAPRWPGLMVALDYLDYEDSPAGEEPEVSAHLVLNQLSSSRR
ncbi:hypothetical protein [Cobetia crustatorum]|uniref:DUF3108 domain-containing protein n=1 Tax=Cobetia crustatorum TaxID=553385 RepID=A0A558HFB3_9GAMM|nr:hypothetical protein [Cobetia crustatorum]TVU67831.1 hypothetical protein FQP86_15805 [Cobetia crustatorum]